jgi:hypothetical protein
MSKDRKQEMNRRNAAIVAVREIERLQNMVNGRQGAVAAATAAKDSGGSCCRSGPSFSAAAEVVRSLRQISAIRTPMPCWIVRLSRTSKDGRT